MNKKTKLEFKQVNNEKSDQNPNRKLNQNKTRKGTEKLVKSELQILHEERKECN